MHSYGSLFLMVKNSSDIYELKNRQNRQTKDFVVIQSIKFTGVCVLKYRIIPNQMSQSSQVVTGKKMTSAGVTPLCTKEKPWKRSQVMYIDCKNQKLILRKEFLGLKITVVES